MEKLDMFDKVRLKTGQTAYIVDIYITTVRHMKRILTCWMALF